MLTQTCKWRPFNSWPSAVKSKESSSELGSLFDRIVLIAKRKISNDNIKDKSKIFKRMFFLIDVVAALEKSRLQLRISFVVHQYLYTVVMPHSHTSHTPSGPTKGRKSTILRSLIPYTVVISCEKELNINSWYRGRHDKSYNRILLVQNSAVDQ